VRDPASPGSASGAHRAALAFGTDWREDVTLHDGTRIVMRLVRAGDKEKLSRGLAQLSPHSRYLRFFTDKPRLTESELRYLTEVDQYDHFAIAAAYSEPDGSEGEGVGIARFVRSSCEPDVAEPAVAVVDAMHGRGLGRILMDRLVAAAAERGVRRFRTEFLAVNRPMKQLLAELSPHCRFAADGPVVTAELDLPTAGPVAAIEASPHHAALRQLLRMMAEQVVQVRRKILEVLGRGRSEDGPPDAED
jgi:GNAT superfamily N-acetyltransferase